MAIPRGNNMERGIRMMMRGKLNSVAMNSMSRKDHCAAPGKRRGIESSLGWKMLFGNRAILQEYSVQNRFDPSIHSPSCSSEPSVMISEKQKKIPL